MRALAVFQQLRVIPCSFVLLLNGLSGLGCSEESVEAVRVCFQRDFILFERVLGALELQQHVGQHLPCRELAIATVVASGQAWTDMATTGGAVNTKAPSTRASQTSSSEMVRISERSA